MLWFFSSFMSITRFLKRQKGKEEEEERPRPEVYADAWRAIVSFLEWPERLGMRAVCRAFYTKQEGLQLGAINEMIILELLPHSGITLRPPDDTDCIHSKPRHQCLEDCHIHRSQDGGTTLLSKCGFDHHMRYNRNWYDSCYLYLNAVLSIYYLTVSLKGSFYGNLVSSERPLKERCRQRVTLLHGSTSIVRAARIAGFLKMNRPRNWDTLFK